MKYDWSSDDEQTDEVCVADWTYCNCAKCMDEHYEELEAEARAEDDQKYVNEYEIDEEGGD